MEIGLSLGSNLADRLANLRAARDRVAALRGVRIVATSAVYETEPVGVSDEFRDKPYLNAVIVIETALPLETFAQRVHAVEDELGRVRCKDRNAPRTIDIDVIYADSDLLDNGTLTVPHPRWAERRFVVQPLADVRPGLVLPRQERTVREVLLALPDEPKVVLSSAEW